MTATAAATAAMMITTTAMIVLRCFGFASAPVVAGDCAGKTPVGAVERLNPASVLCGRMLVSISAAADGVPSFAVPVSLLSDDGSLTRRVPSARQNTSASSVSTRLHAGHRFILRPQQSNPFRLRQSLSGFHSGRVLCRWEYSLRLSGSL